MCHAPALGGHDLLVAGQVSPRTVFAKAGDGGVDQLVIQTVQGLIVHAEPLGCRRSERLDHTVGHPGQIKESTLVVGVGQVEDGALLGPVPDSESGLPSAWVTAERFYLDHFRPVFGQDHAGDAHCRS